MREISVPLPVAMPDEEYTARIESIKTTSMEDVSTRVLKNKEYLRR